jgi:U-box domain
LCPKLLLCCPLTSTKGFVVLQEFKEPVVAADGHTYERVAIEEWLRRKTFSPCTNEEMRSSELRPNWAIIKAMESSRTTNKTITDELFKLFRFL